MERFDFISLRDLPISLATSQPHDFWGGMATRAKQLSEQQSRERSLCVGYLVNKTKDFSESLLTHIYSADVEYCQNYIVHFCTNEIYLFLTQKLSRMF